MTAPSTMTARPAVTARSLPLAILGLVIIGFTSVLVSSVTSMALEALSETFAVAMSSVVWVTTTFVLAAGMTLPAAGWAIDRFGGFAVLLVGLVVFCIGSVGSGSADAFEHLLIARAVQGVGGGVLEPASLALIAQLSQRKRIGTVMGLMSMVIYLAPAIGPLLGAVLLAETGWRGIFLFAVPPILLASVLLTVSVTRERAHPSTSPAARASFDAIGLALAGLGFAAAMLAITQASSGDPLPALASGAFGVAALVTYGWRSLRIAEPLIDLRPFADARFSGAVAIMGVGGTVLFSMLTVVPVLSERAWGLDGLAGAMPLGALGLGMLISMGVSGALSDRYGSHRLTAIASGSTALGLTALAVLEASGTGGHVWVGVVFLFAVGLGYGAVSAPTLAVIYRVLPAEKVGGGTTAALMAVQVGAGWGATGIGAALDGAGSRPFAAVFGILAALMLVATALAGILLRSRAARRA